MERLTLGEGRPWPMGATVRDGGVNVAVFSGHARRVEICLFDEAGREEHARGVLPGRSGDVFHGFLPGAGQGLVYGLRAHGPWEPAEGHRFNPQKVLLDPWAREIVGTFDWNAAHRDADRTHPGIPDPHDNAAAALKARVVADAVDWQGDAPVRHPADAVVLYELHVKGFTERMPGVPAALRGTYRGLGHPAAIAHLTALGVTAVSLLPVHQHLDEERLVRMGLVNYWGYNTIGFFCPDPRFATAPDGATARAEFREMVRALHAAGIAVILDVVYNHTAEGDLTGPSISQRGLDHAHWYRHVGDPPRRLENSTGCGNTVDLRHPRVIQFVLDSLRYWVAEMHVDGFRFDLATVLARGDAGFDRRSAFFAAVQQDPVLAGATLIAEPWDLGTGGYQLGQFPAGWLEWNDTFRDAVRGFWLGGDTTRGAFAQRLAGSSSVFEREGRHPAASVNYVVSHDGFTLRDLVSYNDRHNDANGEVNADGPAHNLSWNCGTEGPTDDPDVRALRARLVRGMLATTLLAQGTPMLAAGDEIGRTQLGNNNAYCQDGPLSWLDWDTADAVLTAYVAHLLEIRRRLQPLSGLRWYHGRPDVLGRHDLQWLRRTGRSLEPHEWGSPRSRVLGAWIGQPGRGNEPLLLLVNARAFDVTFQLPVSRNGRWVGELDSEEPDGRLRRPVPADGRFELRTRTVVLLRDTTLPPDAAPAHGARP
ncbi:MAG: glycogen debranching protein GlgX [Vicinamibacterales bacterium]